MFKSETTFFPLLFPKNTKFLEIWLREVGAKRRLDGPSKVNKYKNLFKKSCFRRSDFKPFLSKNVQIWNQFFPLLFPKKTKSLNFLEIWLWEVRAKRRLNSTSKVNTKTDRHTDTLTYILTYRKHRPRGPFICEILFVGVDIFILLGGQQCHSVQYITVGINIYQWILA